MGNTRKWALVWTSFFFLLGGLAQAQELWPTAEDPEFSTDRPDNTEAPQVVPRGLIQLETGLLFRQDKEGGLREYEFLYPRFLFRLGILRNVELRLVGDHRREQAQPEDRQQRPITTQGFNAFAVGAKVRVLKGEGVVPDIALLGHLTLPFGANPWVPAKVSPLLRLALGHQVTESLQVQYNLGWERDWEDGEFDEVVVYTFSVAQELNDQLTIFGELFGDRARGEGFNHNLDGGLLLKLRPNLQLDLWGGIGLSQNAPDFFVGTGLAIRFPR
jgi:hypothetical protein